MKNSRTCSIVISSVLTSLRLSQTLILIRLKITTLHYCFADFLRYSLVDTHFSHIMMYNDVRICIMFFLLLIHYASKGYPAES